VLTVGSLVGLLWPSALMSLPQEVALLLGLAIGLPHGAGDHLFVSRWPRARFVVAYAAVVGLVLACWPLFPTAYTLVFLLLSAWHFGQGDLHSPAIRPGWAVPAFASRGAVWVGLPLLSADPRAWGVLEAMAAVPLPRPEGLAPILAVVHLGILALAIRRAGRLRGLAEALVLIAWLSTAPPLLGFAVAFAVWHSLPHLQWMHDELGRPWRDLGRQLLLPTLVAAVGTVALLGGVQPHLALVAIAALTAPHALWVHHLVGDAARAAPIAVRRRL
jgi:Brp/Blh family beta-carotene 15,15'-monooxygenase